VVLIAIIFLFVVGFAFFLVWWAHEAEKDRSAMVGLYLILGAPGFMLFIAGLAVTTRRLHTGFALSADAVWLGGEGGTLLFSGTAANTYSGGTTVSAGTLQLGKSAGVNAIPGNLTVSTGGTITWLASEQLPNNSTLTYSGGSLDLAGNTETFGAFTHPLSKYGA